jgi:CheY-like chemotaxis protein
LEEKHAFDAMVIDLNLPGLDGFALYERLAQGSPGSRPPCVFISGRAEGLEKNSSESDPSIEEKEPLHIPAGTMLLEKPFTPVRLIGALKKSLVSGKDFFV